ncbi:hypothetical protein Q3G72_028322 [Acer saccharum]|nr:hypothetical protein Q3G72_028322 [Acer saccharum]
MVKKPRADLSVIMAAPVTATATSYLESVCVDALDRRRHVVIDGWTRFAQNFLIGLRFSLVYEEILNRLAPDFTASKQ